MTPRPTPSARPGRRRRRSWKRHFVIGNHQISEGTGDGQECPSSGSPTLGLTESGAHQHAENQRDRMPGVSEVAPLTTAAPTARESHHPIQAARQRCGIAAVKVPKTPTAP